MFILHHSPTPKKKLPGQMIGDNIWGKIFLKSIIQLYWLHFCHKLIYSIISFFIFFISPLTLKFDVSIGHLWIICYKDGLICPFQLLSTLQLMFSIYIWVVNSISYTLKIVYTSLMYYTLHSPPPTTYIQPQCNTFHMYFCTSPTTAKI